MNLKNNLKRLVGGYIVGFNITSDRMAYAAKKSMKILHSTACTIAPVILTHNIINRFEKARDRAMLKIHKHAICSRCEGKGYLTVMSISGEPVGQVACPQCTMKGYLRMIGKREDLYEITPASAEPVASSKKELAVKVFDSMMNTARKEKTLQVICCPYCKGQRLIHVRDKSGRYQGQKRCPACEGTGKDYKAMATEVLKRCLKDYLAKGYSKEKAWELSMKTCFNTNNLTKEEISHIVEKHLNTIAQSELNIETTVQGTKLLAEVPLHSRM